MTINIQELVMSATTTAHEAGCYARQRFGRVSSIIKSPGQLVTEVDHTTQQLIVERLRRQYPDHGFLAEEGDGAGLFRCPPTGNEDTWWVIDPIDGTRNFAYGASLYCVMIGVIHNGLPIAGAIYDPSSERLYSGGVGIPARCNDTAIQCRQTPMDPDSLVALPCSYPQGVPRSVQQLMQDHVGMVLGSAGLAMAYAATGACWSTLSWRVRLWDIVAGAALIEAAGGIVTNHTGAPRFPINCADYDGSATPMIAGGTAAHQQLLAALAGDDAR